MELKNENTKERNHWKPAAIILAALLIGSGFFIFQSKCLITSTENKLTTEKAGEKALDFINKYLTSGATASLVNVAEDENFYKLDLEINGQEFNSYLTLDGKLLFPQVFNIEEVITAEENREEIAEKSENIVEGSFSEVKDQEVCKENEKPVIYFFGGPSCPHCAWEKPVIEKVASKFKDSISFHNNYGTDEDNDIFSMYSSGGVPALVLGCKYYRLGSGEAIGAEGEEEALTSLICKLTDNQPAEICQ